MVLNSTEGLIYSEIIHTFHEKIRQIALCYTNSNGQVLKTIILAP